MCADWESALIFLWEHVATVLWPRLGGRWSYGGVGAMSRPLPAVMNALLMLTNRP